MIYKNKKNQHLPLIYIYIVFFGGEFSQVLFFFIISLELIILCWTDNCTSYNCLDYNWNIKYIIVLEALFGGYYMKEYYWWQEYIFKTTLEWYNDDDSLFWESYSIDLISILMCVVIIMFRIIETIGVLSLFYPIHWKLREYCKIDTLHLYILLLSSSSFSL